MKHSIIFEIIDKMIFKTFGLLLFLSLSQSKYLFRPNLPMGEYHVVHERLYPCTSTKNHSLQINWYLSKKTSSITELKGNLTFLIPWDDTLTLDANVASWSLTGGWIPNANTLISKKACSFAKSFFGNSWFSMIKAFNIPTDSCPIPVGTYISSGYDLKKFEDNNFPKLYFYGKYKIVVRYKNLKNEEVGCVVAEVNLIRPWETPI